MRSLVDLAWSLLSLGMDALGRVCQPSVFVENNGGDPFRSWLED